MISILTVLAVLFAIIGTMFLIVDFLSDVVETKGWGVFFIITSAAMLLLKFHLTNPEFLSALQK